MSPAAAHSQGAPAPDSLAATVDSLAAGASAGRGLPVDSLAASIDSLAAGGSPADSLASRRSPPAQFWWDETRVLAMLGGGASPLLDRGLEPHSSAITFADLLAHESALWVDRAGVLGAWEVPAQISSGVERLSLWSGGMRVGGAGTPEAVITAVTPLQTGRAYLLAPDPILDPLGEAGDGLLWVEEPSRAWSKTPSAVRLTEGPTGAASQDLELGRVAGDWRAFGAYGHFRSDGRPLWLSPRYSLSRYQDIELSIDRATSWSGWQLKGWNRSSRSALVETGKLDWSAKQLTLQGIIHPQGGWSGQVAVDFVNDELRWLATDRTHARRSSTARAVGRLEIPAGSWHLLFSGGAQAVGVKLDRAPYLVDEDAAGAGFGAGLRRDGERASFLADAGIADSWQGGARGRGHLLLLVRPGGALTLGIEGWTDELAPFVPRADGDFSALLDEGILLPGGLSVGDGEARRATHGEARASLAWGKSRVEAGAFFRRLENAIGLDPEQAASLAPGLRDTLALANDSSADIAGARAELEIHFPLGLRAFGSGRVIASPAADELPLYTARYQGRAGLSLGRLLFKGDLYLEGRLVGLFRDSWTTPYGALPSFERLDGEIVGTVMGQAHFFLATRNLLNDDQASATVVDGQWMTLPFRNTELGLEWHFVN